MSRRILFDDDARRAIGRGVDQLARAVRVTLGPRGRTVLVERLHGPSSITNDGAAVASEVVLADRFENLGVRLVREAAFRTAAQVGDGTSTATVIAHLVVTRGLAAIAQGAAPMALKRGIDRAVLAACAGLREQAQPLASAEERTAVAAIAAGGDAMLGAIVAEALARAGPAGEVAIELGPALETRWTFSAGVSFERGYLSPYFITAPEAMRAELSDARVLLSVRALTEAADVVAALETVRAEGRPLLVIAEDITGEALTTLVVNQLQNVARAAAVQTPGGSAAERRAWLEDLAALTGAAVCGDDAGLAAARITPRELGTCLRAVIEGDRTTVVATAERAASARVLAERRRSQAAQADTAPERERLAKSAARLAGGVSLIAVGGASDSARSEARGRLEDALSALRAATDEGVVPGGGVALVRARAAIDALVLEGDARLGAHLVADALLEPARWIAHNAGADGDTTVAQVRAGSGATGYDASTGRIADLVRAGILDPARVVRVALENAAAVAGLLLTTETLVVDDDEPGHGTGEMA